MGAASSSSANYLASLQSIVSSAVASNVSSCETATQQNINILATKGCHIDIDGSDIEQGLYVNGNCEITQEASADVKQDIETTIEQKADSYAKADLGGLSVAESENWLSLNQAFAASACANNISNCSTTTTQNINVICEGTDSGITLRNTSIKQYAEVVTDCMADQSAMATASQDITTFIDQHAESTAESGLSLTDILVILIFVALLFNMGSLKGLIKPPPVQLSNVCLTTLYGLLMLLLTPNFLEAISGVCCWLVGVFSNSAKKSCYSAFRSSWAMTCTFPILMLTFFMVPLVGKVLVAWLGTSFVDISIAFLVALGISMVLYFVDKNKKDEELKDGTKKLKTNKYEDLSWLPMFSGFAAMVLFRVGLWLWQLRHPQT
jgi:hypothetical protein